MKFSLLTFSLMLVCCALPASAQNLILNPDFEEDPQDVIGTVSNWTVSGTGFVASSSEGATSGTLAAVLSIGSDTQGNVLSQTFHTTAGDTYMVEWDSGVFGVRSADRLQLNVQIAGNAILLNRTITPPDASTSSASEVSFQHYRYVFTADSSTTTLQFTDAGLGNSDADVLIDTVSVVPTTAATPTILPLQNGDFETGPFNVTGVATGWTSFGAGRVAALDEGATSGTHSLAFGPGGDFQNNVISQRFFTNPGHEYSVDFDAAVYGMSDSIQMLALNVLGDAEILNEIVTPPYVGTFDPTAVQFQHYHFVFAADSSISTIQFSDVGVDNADADVVLDTVSVAPIPQTFAQWQAEHFTVDQLNDPQISGWDADPDRDNIANGLEYFFNTDPVNGILVTDSAALPRIAIETSESSSYVTYTFRRLVGWSGNAAVVGVSDDLTTWDETETQIELASVTPSGDGVTETVTVRLTTPLDQITTGKKFLRVSLTQ